MAKEGVENIIKYTKSRRPSLRPGEEEKSMPHTLDEFNQLTLPLFEAHRAEIQPLCEAYTENLARAPDPDADLYCTGVLVALRGLAANPSRLDVLIKLLARLITVTWYVPLREKPISFFDVSGCFAVRPNGAAEVFAILDKLESCTGYVEGAKGLASVLRSITTFVFYNISLSPEIVLDRYGHMIDALALCSKRVGDGFRLTPTGSDTHMGGHQAVFLTPGTGFRMVYKPRSLTADLAFYKLVDYFNRLQAGARIGHPLLSITIQELQGDWGTEFFVQRVSAPLTHKEAEIYYCQMGELMFLAKLFGMGDLHQDNLIPTDSGPVIIDAECCLQPDVLTIDRLNKTQLFEAVRRCETADPAQTASSVFQIGEDCSINVYKRYISQIVKGFQAARQILGGNITALLEELMGLYAIVEKIRVLPLSTRGFAMIDLSRPLDKTSEGEHLLAGLNQLLVGTRFDQSALLDSMKRALDRYDIPYCYFEPGAGRNVWYLMCEGQQLSATDFYSANHLWEVLNRNLCWLLTDAPVQELLNEL